jgi:CNP1-like family
VNRRVTLALLAVLIGAACAPTPNPSALPSSSEAPPEEKMTASKAGLTLPAWPADANLVPYQLSRAAALRYFVDGQSISVANNDIVRFTLVAKGTGSAENVSYEAFRCSTGERTTYAYGKTDRTWREVADPQWAPIARGDEARNVLLAYHLCPARRAVKDAAEGVNALKYGHPSATGVEGGLRPDRGF